MQLGQFGRRIKGAGGGGGGYGGISRLQFGGADGSTTFTDDNGRIWTAFGNAQIDTSLGDQRGLFDGNGDYITTPSNANLDLPGDFTIKFTKRFNDKSGFQTIAQRGYSTGSSGTGWLIQTGNGDGRINFYTQAGVLIVGESSGTINNGQDYLIEVVRTSGNISIKRDGVVVAGPVGNVQNFARDGELAIGGGSSTGYNNFWFNGWISAWEIP